MTLAAVREVLVAINGDCVSPYKLAQAVNRALLTEYPAPSCEPAAYEDASRRVDQFLIGAGWQAHVEAPERESLVRVLLSLEGLGMPGLVEELGPYVDSVERITGAEFESHEPMGDAEKIVAKVVLFESAFAIMRRIAFSHHLALQDDHS